MKKITDIFAMIFVSLVLGAGLFFSCSAAGEDNSDLPRAEKEAAEWTKLNNIGISITETSTNGIVSERDSGTVGGIARHYSDDTKKYAVIYFEAAPNDNYTFTLDGITVTTDPASNNITKKLYTQKANYFYITIPIETKIVTINASSAFVAQQS